MADRYEQAVAGKPLGLADYAIGGGIDRGAGRRGEIDAGVLAATAPIILTLDGDGQNPPEELPKLAAPLLNDSTGKIGLVAGQRVRGLAHGDEQGGLSGAPVLEKSTHVIKRLYSELGDDVPIIGVGGISSGEHAVEKIRAGAKLVQMYTGLIYKGPALVTECAATIRLNCKRKAHANRT